MAEQASEMPMSPKPQSAKIGRPAAYSDAIAEEILVRIADGESLRAICRDGHMPCKETVRMWFRTDERFLARYARARADQAHSHYDEILDTARAATPLDAAAARLKVDALKWAAAKMLPKVYGERLDLNVSQKPAAGMTDDELIAIASRGGAGTPEAEEGAE